MEAVRDYAAGSRAPARSYGNSVSLGIIDEIPDYEEVFDIAHTLYNAELGLKSLPVLT